MQSKNQISLATAILININIMVGAGIFLNPPLMTTKAGGLSYLGWLISALVVLPIIVSVAAISKILPEKGSFYSYSKNGINKTAGFISGWVYSLGYVSTMAIQMVGLRDILMYQLNIGFVNNYTTLFNALFFLTFAFLCSFKLTIVGKIQSSTALLKLIPILLFSCAALFFLPTIFWLWTSKSISFPSLDESFKLSSVINTLPLAIFGYWGFESCTHISHSIENSKKNAPRAIIIGFLITVIVYTTAHMGLFNVMGQNNLSLLGVTAFASFLPVSLPVQAFLTFTLTVAILLAYASAIYGELNNVGHLLHAMAQEKLIFCSSFLKKKNSHNQPIVTIFLLATLAFLFATLIDGKSILISIANLGLLSAFTLTTLSLFFLQLRIKAHFKNMIMTMFSFASCGIIAFYSWQAIDNPYYTLPFFLLLGGGIIMYMIQTKTLKEAK
jgi:amino acid transporter